MVQERAAGENEGKVINSKIIYQNY